MIILFPELVFQILEIEILNYKTVNYEKIAQVVILVSKNFFLNNFKPQILSLGHFL